jgi:hypothetical protein
MTERTIIPIGLYIVNTVKNDTLSRATQLTFLGAIAMDTWRDPTIVWRASIGGNSFADGDSVRNFGIAGLAYPFTPKAGKEARSDAITVFEKAVRRYAVPSFVWYDERRRTNGSSSYVGWIDSANGARNGFERDMLDPHAWDALLRQFVSLYSDKSGFVKAYGERMNLMAQRSLDSITG